jgi:hypothetical protein
VLEFLAEWIVCIQQAGARNQDLREIGEDAPVVTLVGVGAKVDRETRPRMPM